MATIHELEMARAAPPPHEFDQAADEDASHATENRMSLLAMCSQNRDYLDISKACSPRSRAVSSAYPMR